MAWFSRRSSPPADPGELAGWMKEQFERRRYKDVWRHREQLGVGLAQGDMPDDVWFWINAYPALAALRANIQWENPFGQPDKPPLVSTCAAYADEVHGRLGPDEAAANREIAHRFFA